MKRSAVRLACAAGALVTLTCGALALSSGDSLVSLSYLKNQFIPTAVQQGERAGGDKLQAVYDGAKKDLDAVQNALMGGESAGSGSVSATLQARDWREGDSLSLPTGSGVLLLEGSAQVTHGGAVVDVTEGAETPSGGRLLPNHRYLVGEDTMAEVRILSGAARMGVQGTYRLTGGTGKTTPFFDVSQTDWYYAPVQYVYQNDLFSGMDERHFAPGAAMNRAMLMTVLYRMAGSPSGELAGASVSFADVPDGAWYADYVRWGAAQGITAGTSPSTFSPDQQVTRQQVAALLRSFAGSYLGLNTDKRADLSGYQDLDQASDWARDALSWAVAEGVMGSSSNGALTLSPQKNASRAEVAAMLRTFSERLL